MGQEATTAQDQDQHQDFQQEQDDQQQNEFKKIASPGLSDDDQTAEFEDQSPKKIATLYEDSREGAQTTLMNHPMSYSKLQL